MDATGSSHHKAIPQQIGETLMVTSPYQALAVAHLLKYHLPRAIQHPRLQDAAHTVRKVGSSRSFETAKN